MFQFSLIKLRFINYFLLALILIAALFTARALISFFAYKDSGISSVPLDNSALINTAKPIDIMQYSLIVIKNPFGSPKIFHTITPSENLKPETYMQEIPPAELTLVGTVVGKKNMSYAVFEGNAITSPNKQEVFAHGDAIYDYGTLDEILTDSVVIRQGANTHILKIIESLSNLTNYPADNNQAYKNTSSADPFVKKVGKRQFQLDKKQVQDSINNPEKILTDARLLPNFINGKQEGYKISEVKPGGLYESIGLKNGDVLIRVNSLEISSPEVAIQTMSALRGTNNVNLDIIRNNERMSLNYQIK
ncbi:MAG: type II secretion system protein N [Thermodesulfovibrionia bacterium]|nr:type II secretion system protein N [Thermodesulfovibrionia bacterium]